MSTTEQKVPTPVQTPGTEVSPGRTLNIRMRPNTQTQEGVIVCDRIGATGKVAVEPRVLEEQR
ncbi:hypothetical protein PC110_g10401 [Phytophthora cactorum]|nr:hypothetical protein PC110_g10401 [Phytophthora cactorum]